jgi:hypothetical protein
MALIKQNNVATAKTMSNSLIMFNPSPR